MLNLLHVKTFLAVLDHGSFHAAGHHLGIAQPTVSQHVKKLERDLGVALLDRAPQRPRPTPRGRVFQAYARRLIAVADRAREVLDGRTVRIGASSNIGIYLLPPFLKRFAETVAPGIGLVPWIGPNPEVAARLDDGELDLGLMEWWDGRPGFQARSWRREPIVVIVPPDHPWAERPAIAPADLTRVPIVGGEGGTGTGRLLQQLFGADADRLKTAITLGSTEAVKEAVKAGLGVSMVFESAVREELSAGSLRAVAVDGLEIAKELFVIVPSDLPDTSPVRRFAGMF